MPGTSYDLLALQTALGGEFVIERELGRGGMGIVYLARDVELERPVAIKVLPPEYAVRPELRERFLREARTAAKLSHPNIVPVHRADDVGGFVFFVMAFVDGETLGQRIRSRGPIPPPMAARMLREVAWALAYAHARGVVHRDIKPDNILLDRESGRALVTDFGIALRSDGRALTDEGNVMGTAQFMSPEQASGETLDGRSDLYSLGVVGYLALTGDLPFDGPTVQAVLAKHLTATHSPLIGRHGVPEPLAKAVDKCLVKSAEERWTNGEALADAIGDATPQTPAVPAPIRVWLSRGAWLDPVLGVWYLVLAISMLDGDILAWSTLAAAVIPLIVYGLVNGALARRALDAGYGYQDLLSGLRQQLEERREERRYDVMREPPVLFKLVRWAAYASWATIAAALIGLARDSTTAFTDQLIASNGPLFAWICLVAVGGSAFGLMYPGRRLSEKDWGDAARWAFWHGPIGRTLVEWAATGGDARTRATSAHRPTEVAIGLAAQDLYDALPRATQQRFRDLPRVVRGLEDEAQSIRAKLASLANTAARVADHAKAATPERAALLADLESARVREQQRLTLIIGALEGIRLDLLRLSAGVGDPDSLTKAVAAATRFGRDVDAAVRPAG